MAYLAHALMPAPLNPNCLTATVEALAVRRGLVPHLALAHFEHEFHLRNVAALPAIVDGKAAFEVDGAFPYAFAPQAVTGRVYDRMRQRCGLEVGIEHLPGGDALLSRLAQLDHHAVVMLDPFHLAGRHEHGVTHGLIFVLVNGVDADGRLGALEQNVGQLHLSREAMKASAEHFARTRGSVEIHHPIAVPPTRDVTAVEVAADIARFLANHRDGSPHAGRQGLASFEALYAAHLELDQVFAVPGTWKMFGERHANARFLEAARDAGLPFAAGYGGLDALAAGYRECGDIWLAIHRFQQFAQKSGGARLLRRNLDSIRELRQAEDRLAERLDEHAHWLAALQ